MTDSKKCKACETIDETEAAAYRRTIDDLRRQLSAKTAELAAAKAESERLSALLQEKIDRENIPCADALDRLWKEIILASKPNYGDWEYAGQAYRHLKAEFDEQAAQLAAANAIIERLHPRVMRLVSKGRRFIVIGEHEPYYRKAYDLIRGQEKSAGTWTDEDEEFYARAVIRWHDIQQSALAAGKETK